MSKVIFIGFNLAIALLLSGRAYAEDIARGDVDALMAECQTQRQANIAPLREEAIEHCIENRRNDREYCERYNRNYGERTQGGTQRGLFWHLPACEKAVAAERYFRMNPGRQLFTYE